MTKQDKKNAFLYCKFRDEQYALYDDYAKRNGLSMKSLLVINALYYAKDGMTQREICDRTFNTKQTVNLVIKNLLAEESVTISEMKEDKRNKIVQMTESGKKKYRKVITHITHSEDTAMSLFSPEEQEQLVALSRRFTQELTRLVNGDNDE